MIAFHLRILQRYIAVVVRIFQEKPLFIIPFGQSVPDAEEVDLITADGLTLKGCYLKSQAARKGVILFGVEFGATRWSCVCYCEFLRQGGYDIFAFDETFSILFDLSTNVQNGAEDPFESMTSAPGDHVVIVRETGGEARFLHLSGVGATLPVSTWKNLPS